MARVIEILVCRSFLGWFFHVWGNFFGKSHKRCSCKEGVIWRRLFWSVPVLQGFCRQWLHSSSKISRLAYCWTCTWAVVKDEIVLLFGMESVLQVVVATVDCPDVLQVMSSSSISCFQASFPARNKLFGTLTILDMFISQWCSMAPFPVDVSYTEWWTGY